MFRRTLARLHKHIAEYIAVEDPEERIIGSEEVILDPAYNGRYEGERELQRLSEAIEAEEDNQ